MQLKILKERKLEFIVYLLQVLNGLKEPTILARRNIIWKHVLPYINDDMKNYIDKITIVKI